jgi:hypothetical protein
MGDAQKTKHLHRKLMTNVIAALSQPSLPSFVEIRYDRYNETIKKRLRINGRNET